MGKILLTSILKCLITKYTFSDFIYTPIKITIIIFISRDENPVLNICFYYMHEKNGTRITSIERKNNGFFYFVYRNVHMNLIVILKLENIDFLNS